MASVGSGLATSIAHAQSPALFVAEADDGFTVSHGGKAWRVTGEALRRAWGKDARPVARAALNGGVIVSVKGVLAGRAPAALDLAITPHPSGRWTVQASIDVPGFGPLAGKSVDGPPKNLPAGRVAANHCASILGMQLAGGAGSALLELDQDLTVELVSASGFLLAPGVVAIGRLVLLPVSASDKPATIGRMSPAVFKSVGALGEVAGLSLKARPENGALLVMVENGVPNARTDGPTNITIGDIEFRCGWGSFNYPGGSQGWKVETALTNEDQKVKAPAGQIVVRTKNDVDLVLAGRGGSINHFDFSAALVHSALRLPLSAKSSGFVDFGRLDFENDPTIRFTLGEFGGKADPRESHVPLDRNRPAFLSLENAKLTVRRELDMFCATFRFRGLGLELRNGKAQILRPPTAKGPCSLIVDLPPQHIQEQAFARVLPQLPGRALTSPQLLSAYQLSERKDLRTALAKNDKAFEIFANDYETQYGQACEDLDKSNATTGRNQRRRALYPSAATRVLEAVYVGRDGLITPLGRQVARKVAESKSDDFLPKLEDLRLGLAEVVVGDVLRRHGWLRDQMRLGDAAKLGGPTKSSPQATLLEILREAAKRNGDLARVLQASDSKMDTPILLASWKAQWPKDLLKTSKERRAFVEVLTQFPVLKGEQEGPLKAALQAPYKNKLPNSAKTPVAAYASGTTHLVFDLDKLIEKDAIVWCLESLMDWGSLQLRVSRRAAPLGEPRPAGAPPISGEDELRGLLKRQGVSAGTTLQKRLEDIQDQVAHRRDKDGTAIDTAIELPARLFLSPERSVTFRTPSAPRLGAHVAPLWFAEMKELPGQPYTLRAIDSPDFSVEAFKQPPRTPLRGAQATKYSDTIFALDDFDRHQIVALSSLYGLPVLARRSPQGTAQTSQVAPPPEWEIKDDLLAVDVEEQALYAPRALPTRLLRLSALGASLDLRATFVPPASLRWKSGENAFDAFSLERWNCLIAAGREVTTEVVYKGFLYPLGFRASLVKLTERAFLPSRVDRQWSRPIAYLVQRYFIQVSNPVKSYPAPAQPFAGRGWPAQTMELLTRATPDLLDPTRESSGPTHQAWGEWPNGRLHSDDTTGLVFWPRTAPGISGDVRFRMTINGRPEPVSMPLLFVDNQAAHDPMTMRLLQQYYNSSRNVEDARQPTWEADRSLDHAGARRRYAPEGEPGDTTFETQRWAVRVDSRRASLVPAFTAAEPKTELDDYLVNSAMESDDQPPFYPRCDVAFIRHDASAKFTGTPQASAPVRFLERYLEAGLPILTDEEMGDGSDQTVEAARTKVINGELKGKPENIKVMREAFLRVELKGEASLPKLALGNNGDRSGGVARPELNISAIGRRGPIGVGEPKQRQPPAPGTAMGPKFVAASARILGIVDLSTFIEAVVERVAPMLRDIVAYSANALADVAKKVRDPLGEVIAAIDKQPVAKAAYAPAYNSLVELHRLIDPAALDPKSLDQKKLLPVTEILVAARVVGQELERIASSPLAQLNQVAEGDLRKTRSDLAKLGVDLLRKVLGEAFAIAQAGSRFVEAAGMLLPKAEVFRELERLIAQVPGGADKDIELLRNDVQHVLKGAGDHALQSAETLPETLTAGWQWYLDEVARGLPREGRTGWVKSAEEQLKKSILPFREVQQPAALENLYAAWRLAAKGDVVGAIEELDDYWLPWLADWAKGAVEDVCRAPADALNKAVNDLRAALMPQKLPELDCRPDECGTGQPKEELCAKLWALCGKLDSNQRKPAQQLAEALDQFQRASAALPSGNECDPPFVSRLRTLEVYRQNLLSALKEWVSQLAHLNVELPKETAKAAAEAAAAILEAILPEQADPVKLQAALVKVLGTAAPGSIQATIDAYKQVRALPSAFSKCETVAEVRAQAAGAVAAIEAVRNAGQEAVGRLSAITGLPALSVTNSWAANTLSQLGTALRTAVTERNKAKDQLAAVDTRLGLKESESLAGLLVVAPHADLGNPPPGGDRLSQELAFVQAAMARKPPTPFVDLLTLLRVWHSDGPGVMLVLKGMDQRLFEALRARALRLIDVDGLRDKLNALLASVVPATRTLEYKWDLKSPQVVKVGTLATVRMPSLELKSTSVINLREPAAPVQSSMTGRLAAFDITINDWVTLNFSNMEFEGGTGRDFKLTAPQLKGFVPLGRLVFLSALAAYLGVQDGSTATAEPNGPYLIPRPTGGAGLQAGYRLSFGAVQLGTVALIDLGFDAHAELPFNDDPGAVRILLSTPEKPFLICAAPYGGSGYVQLESGPSGRERLNISLQWGGAAAIAYGPLQGTGRIMTGFRVRKDPGQFKLFATFVAAFEGHIACFGIAASFVVTMDYSGGKLRGTATLTYSFSLGIAKKDFSVSVARDAGSKLGDKQSSNFLRDDPRVIPVADGATSTASMLCDVPAGMEDWGARSARYSLLRARGRRFVR